MKHIDCIFTTYGVYFLPDKIFIASIEIPKTPNKHQLLIMMALVAQTDQKDIAITRKVYDSDIMLVSINADLIRVKWSD